MMRYNKKGQAALEFLTTYGWAFLVILVMIGALGYFGVLSPGNFLPQRCSVGPEFTCNDYQATSNGTNAKVETILKNNLGEAMTLVSADFTASSGALSLSCIASPLTVAAGGELTLTCENLTGGTSIPPIGDKVKYLIQGKYQPVGKTFNKPITAEIYATIQQG